MLENFQGMHPPRIRTPSYHPTLSDDYKPLSNCGFYVLFLAQPAQYGGNLDGDRLRLRMMGLKVFDFVLSEPDAVFYKSYNGLGA
jgi:hypothetical protein